MPTVIKVGGSILEPAPQPELISAVQQETIQGPVIVVHGGGKTLTALLQRLGVATEFRAGLRVTSPAVLHAAVMAFAGTVNTTLVAALNAAGVRAVGLTGCDAASVCAMPHPELGAVGEITSADPRLLQTLLAVGCTPVLASLALQQGSAALLNVNADQFATSVAASIGAERLLFLTDVNGVLDAAGHPLARASLSELDALAACGALSGGMLPKTAACAAALRAGVPNVSIIGPAWSGTRLSL